MRHIRCQRSWFAIAFIHAAAFGAEPGVPTLNLMPLPQKMVRTAGALPISASFSVKIKSLADARLQRGVSRFLLHLSEQTGIPMGLPWAVSTTPTLIVDALSSGPSVETVGEDESYLLDVTPEHAHLSAKTDVGVLRGLETFLQLVEQSAHGFSAPAIHIEDRPRFAWRGLLIDATSHFVPVEVVKRNLDAMAAVKLNVFHWHLTDDQGFRVESKRFPKLHQLGSDSQYYTQDQVREVIAYAHDRGIRVLPEFDMPGHCASWLVGYPELASAPGPYNIIHTFGVYDPALDPTRDEVYQFLDTLLGEMTALFPDAYFHIGGDEVNGKDWHKNTRIQAFILDHQLKDEHGLQTYFNTRLEKLVRKHGKLTVGWDEILHPDLPRDIMIHSWRDQESLATAVKQGHPAILSFGYYLDHLDRAEYHYNIDPQGGPAQNLSAAQQAQILGGESCMWTEFISMETIDSRTWPRTAAIAERLWSSPDVRDVRSMYQRLSVVSERLDYAGVQHRRNYEDMLARLTAGQPTHALRVLADVVEPLGIDERERAQRYSQSTPFNRLVDAARAESATVTELQYEIDDLAQASSNAADWTHVEAVLHSWQHNNAQLSPLLNQRPLLTEASPISKNLADVGAIGLEAIAYIKSGHPPSSQWMDRQTEALKTKEQPTAEVVLAAVRPVRKLVMAAGQVHPVGHL